MVDQFRKINSTTLAAPRRGKPPIAPEGYEQDPRDPFLYHLTMPVCEYREERIVSRPCCKKVIVWCNLVNCPTSRFACIKRCPKNEDHTTDNNV